MAAKLSYDDQNKLLTATGYLDPTTQAAIKAALAVGTTDTIDKVGPGAGLALTPLSMTNIVPGAVLLIDSGVNAELIVVFQVTANSFTADLAFAHDGTGTPFAIVNDPGLPAAIDALGLANQQVVGPFFAQYPELLPLYTGFVATKEPLTQRYTDLLASFLPILQRERKAQQALTDISAAIGQDSSFATALLQDPNVIHASADATSAAVVDLTGVEAGGLSAHIYLDGNPAGANPQITDISGSIQFAQVAVLSGNLAVGATVTTLIDGVQVPYVLTAADVDFPTLAGNVAKAINASTAIDPKSGSPIGSVIAASAAGPAVVLTSRSPADTQGVPSPSPAIRRAPASSMQPTQGPLSAAIVVATAGRMSPALPAGGERRQPARRVAFRAISSRRRMGRSISVLWSIPVRRRRR